jgi:hypothetical protein
MTQDQSLREHLIYLLDGGGAHLLSSGQMVLVRRMLGAWK